MKIFTCLFFILTLSKAYAGANDLLPMSIKDRVRIELLVEGIPEFNDLSKSEINLPSEVLKPLQDLEKSL
jgi:hypothetical protein